MPLNVAVQMDPIERINIRGDSTFALLLEAQARGHALFYYTPPPFDLPYITSTHMLERVPPTTLVVNDPAQVRNAPEKVFVTEFPDLMPPTLVTRDLAAIKKFRAEHGDIVIKPLYGKGGEAVFRVAPEDLNFGSLYDLFATPVRPPRVGAKLLPGVKD